MSNERSAFKVKLEHRVDWSELDLFGHVNNVEFFKYLQSGRVEYWMRMGLYGKQKETGLGPILASAKCDFKLPLFFPETITIHTRLEFMKRSSFGFEHRIENSKGEVSAIGHDVVVMFNFRKNSSVEIPEEFRLAAAAIEGDNQFML